MSFQQALQPKTSANGFGRGSRSENKLHSGKSIPRSGNTGLARTMSGGKTGVYEGPSRDRIVYLTTCLVGLPVEVQLRNGSVYSGTCFTANTEKEFEISLKMARMVKDVSCCGQKTEFVSKAPIKTFIIPGKEVVQVIAKEVPVMTNGRYSELQNERQHEIMIDSYISQSRHLDLERELAPWADEDGPQYHELDNIFDDPWNRGWDQFEINKQLFGVKSTFNEELYTTKLERGPRTRELEKEAIRIAREIEGEDTQDLHLAEERGIHLHGNFDIDEETRFSAVYRVKVDDSGYDEDENIILDSRNDETLGNAPASLVIKSADLTHGNDVEEARLLSRTSVDETECSQSSNSTDLYQIGSSGNPMQFASEIPSKNIVSSDGGSRSLDNLDSEHGRNDSIIKSVDDEKPKEDAQVQKSNDSQYGKKDSLEKGEAILYRNGISTAPQSHAIIKNNDKTSSPVELSEGAQSVKRVGEALTTNNCGRPDSSSSSNSERAGSSSTSSAPGLSLSSSIGSLASEKSTLNPHAKEFKFNPNAKSFTPSQNPVRPPSPVSDGSFYFPTNVSTLPHLHGLPMGIMGSSFGGHQPVIVNPSVSPLQTPQAYYHPNAPQYGQQMLLGHHSPVLYMPTYQPEMAYKGRDF